MTLPEETRMPSPALETSSGVDAGIPFDEESRHQWDINDTTLPLILEAECYQDWPNGHCKYVYLEESEEARRHTSGWAMRNTNNHNVNILKKSCLGVLVCSLRCIRESRDSVHMRPAICDKARKKQLGKPCPNPRCDGRLELQPCRGHCGYPVTHFWRHINGFIFFQAKGVHDHPQPDMKSSSESRRHPYNAKENKHPLLDRRSRKRSLYTTTEDLPPAKIQHLDVIQHVVNPGKDMMCSCPPFECVCHLGAISRSPVMHHQTPHPTYNSTPSYLPPADTKYPGMTELNFSPQWKDSYNEYFDFKAECNPVNKYRSPVPVSSYGVEPSLNLHNLSKSMSSPDYSSRPFFSTPSYQATSTLSPTYPSGSMLSAPKVPSSTCMYSSYQSNPLMSHTDLHNTSRGSDSGFLSINGHTSPHPTAATAADCSRTTIEEFDMTNPGDFLSLDQPINKDLLSFGMSSQSGNDFYSSCAKEADSHKLISPAVDLSAFLPSITYFLEEEQEAITSESKMVDPSQKVSYNGHYPSQPTRPVKSEVMSPPPHLSPCRGSSPHSLTELQPVHKPQYSQYSQYSQADCHLSTPSRTDCSYTDSTPLSSLLQYADSKTTSDFFDSFSFYNGEICSSVPSLLEQALM